jgi:hypothetical protein
MNSSYVRTSSDHTPTCVLQNKCGSRGIYRLPANKLFQLAPAQSMLSSVIVLCPSISLHWLCLLLTNLHGQGQRPAIMIKVTFTCDLGSTYSRKVTRDVVANMHRHLFVTSLSVPSRRNGRAWGNTILWRGSQPLISTRYTNCSIVLSGDTHCRARWSSSFTPNSTPPSTERGNGPNCSHAHSTLITYNCSRKSRTNDPSTTVLCMLHP